MLAPDAPCPCRSGLTLSQCCSPDVPPIADQRESYSQISITAKLITTRQFVVPLPSNMTVTSTLRQPHDMDAAVMNMCGKLLQDYLREVELWLPPAAVLQDLPLYMTDFGDCLEALDDALHAVRYHEKQFLSRLRMLEAKRTVSPFRPGGNVNVVLDDSSLRYELQAFLVSLSTVLDSIARTASVALWRSKVEWGKTSNLTWGQFRRRIDRSGQVTPEAHKALHAALRPYAERIREYDEMRDAIIHEAKLRQYRGFEYRRARLVSPEVSSLSADHLCFSAWRDILGIAESVLTAAIQHMQRGPS